jgi:hypothetical protein
MSLSQNYFPLRKERRLKCGLKCTIRTFMYLMQEIILFLSRTQKYTGRMEVQLRSFLTSALTDISGKLHRQYTINSVINNHVIYWRQVSAVYWSSPELKITSSE